MSLRDLDYQRFKYRKTPLRTVVCQLRFNPILKIGQQMPVELQDRIRGTFPKFLREESAGFRLAPGVGLEALPSSPAVWRFKTEDDAWTASLSVDAVSLETSQYQDFPDFERRFLMLEAALQSVYGIDHYVRTGLRYINTFAEQDFAGGWLDRFNPGLLGPMADPILGSQVLESVQIFVLADEDGTIKVRHGLEDGQYHLDIDHATENRVEAIDVRQRLRDFNLRIYQVFRWSISDGMHQEMEPGPHE